MNIFRCRTFRSLIKELDVILVLGAKAKVEALRVLDNLFKLQDLNCLDSYL